MAQRGRQAVGIPRPAAGKAWVKPGSVCLAWERRGLAVPGRQAAGRMIREVAQARMRESVVVFVFLLSVRPLSAEQGVIGEGGMLWRSAVAIRVSRGVRLGDNAGFSLLCTHGLIVLFRRVLLAVVVSAQLSDVTVGERNKFYHDELRGIFVCLPEFCNICGNNVFVVMVTYSELRRGKLASSLSLLLTSMCDWFSSA